jgi:four helix bundle protein
VRYDKSWRDPHDLNERVFRFACEIVRLCGTSVAANYEESQGGCSPREFLAKQRIALREARETRYWLRLLDACDLVDTPPTPLQALITESREPVAILTASTKTAQISASRRKER